MKRKVYIDLLKWKKSPRRKPLILRGARQVGKTWLMKEFGRLEYHNYAYFNFEENVGLDSILSQQFDVERIIADLSLVAGERIEQEKTLIIFDEIQASQYGLGSLKFFQENANKYHIVAAGSLLGLKMSGPKSFPVGKVNFLDLYPLSFIEFLEGIGKDMFVGLIQRRETVAEVLHEELNQLLKRYLYTGGMPEVIATYLETLDLREVREVQKEILRAYELDFAKHASSTDAPKITMIWNSLPSQLGRENKKFIYGALKTGARAREYESALQWLEDAGLVLKAYNVSQPSIPLKSYSKSNIFKIFMFDVGLLGAMADLSAKVLLEGDRLFKEFNGALTENYVAQALTAETLEALFYWTSRGTAEVDFLCQGEDEVIPLEVKAGMNLKGKSLKVYCQKYHVRTAAKMSLRNYKKEDWVIQYPLYSVSEFSRFLKE